MFGNDDPDSFQAEQPPAKKSRSESPKKPKKEKKKKEKKEKKKKKDKNTIDMEIDSEDLDDGCPMNDRNLKITRKLNGERKIAISPTDEIKITTSKSPNRGSRDRRNYSKDSSPGRRKNQSPTRRKSPKDRERNRSPSDRKYTNDASRSRIRSPSRSPPRRKLSKNRERSSKSPVKRNYSKESMDLPKMTVKNDQNQQPKLTGLYHPITWDGRKPILGLGNAMMFFRGWETAARMIEEDRLAKEKEAEAKAARDKEYIRDPADIEMVGKNIKLKILTKTRNFTGKIIRRKLNFLIFQRVSHGTTSVFWQNPQQATPQHRRPRPSNAPNG